MVLEVMGNGSYTVWVTMQFNNADGGVPARGHVRRSAGSPSKSLSSRGPPLRRQAAWRLCRVCCLGVGKSLQGTRVGRRAVMQSSRGLMHLHGADAQSVEGSTGLELHCMHACQQEHRVGM